MKISQTQFHKDICLREKSSPLKTKSLSMDIKTMFQNHKLGQRLTIKSLQLTNQFYFKLIREYLEPKVKN